MVKNDMGEMHDCCIALCTMHYYALCTKYYYALCTRHYFTMHLYTAAKNTYFLINLYTVKKIQDRSHKAKGCTDVLVWLRVESQREVSLNLEGIFPLHKGIKIRTPTIYFADFHKA